MLVSTDTLWIKSFAEIALYLTSFSWYKHFWKKIRKFKMTAIFGKWNICKLGKARLHRYPVGQKFCGNPPSKFLFYWENSFKIKVLVYQYCSICVPYEPIFNSVFCIFFCQKFENWIWPHFWGGENLWKIGKVLCLDTLWVENFDEIALS